MLLMHVLHGRLKSCRGYIWKYDVIVNEIGGADGIS
jgi:hypothetical protein